VYGVMEVARLCRLMWLCLKSQIAVIWQREFSVMSQRDYGLQPV
jgi:hypothetical protein